MDAGYGNGGAGGLPPKLDLRKSGVLKEAPAVAPVLTPVPAPAPAPVPAPVSTSVPEIKPAAPAAPAQPVVPKLPLFGSKPVAPKLAPRPLGAKPVVTPGVASAVVPVAEAAEEAIIILSSTDGPADAGETPALKPVMKPVAVAPKPIVPAVPVTPAQPVPAASPAPMTPNPMAPRPMIKPASAGAAPVSLRPVAGKPLVKPASAPVTPVVAPAVAAKKETSKIPLGAAKALSAAKDGAAVGVDSKTIKIKPTALGTVKAPIAVPAGADSSEDEMDEKRKTSRISLESVLGAKDGSAGSAAGPKTIKLKRPSETTVIKDVPGGFQPKNKDSLNKTARIDISNVDADASPTLKRTIKVKRPTQMQAVQPLGGADGQPADSRVVGVGRGGATGLQPFTAAESGMHWIFPVCALLTVFVVLVTIYMFMSQVFGPDISLSKLSYGAPNLNLPWPNKLGLY